MLFLHREDSQEVKQFAPVVCEAFSRGFQNCTDCTDTKLFMNYWCVLVAKILGCSRRCEVSRSKMIFSLSSGLMRQAWASVFSSGILSIGQTETTEQSPVKRHESSEGIGAFLLYWKNGRTMTVHPGEKIEPKQLRNFWESVQNIEPIDRARDRRFCSNIRKHFFIRQGTDYWNMLTKEVIESLYLDIFETYYV